MRENHILIIDDDLMLLKTAEEILSDQYNVSVAKSGIQALNLLNKNIIPDLILLDIDMPELGGREVMRELRKNYPEIKVIILSSHYIKRVILDFVQLGVKAFISKTGEKTKLIDVIKIVIKEGIYFDAYITGILANELAKTSENNSSEVDSIKFSDVELNIIKLLCQNKLSKEIALALNLNIRTIEYHRFQIMKRTKSKKVSDLILYSLRNNLVKVV